MRSVIPGLCSEKSPGFRKAAPHVLVAEGKIDKRIHFI